MYWCVLKYFLLRCWIRKFWFSLPVFPLVFSLWMTLTLFNWKAPKYFLLFTRLLKSRYKILNFCKLIIWIFPVSLCNRKIMLWSNGNIILILFWLHYSLSLEGDNFQFPIKNSTSHCEVNFVLLDYGRYGALGRRY